jgi:hypothetical protein
MGLPERKTLPGSSQAASLRAAGGPGAGPPHPATQYVSLSREQPAPQALTCCG